MSTQSREPTDLFISYVPTDGDWVEHYLVKGLEPLKLKIKHEATFTPGVPPLIESEQGIINSRWTLLVLSPAYVGDNYEQFIKLIAQTHSINSKHWSVIVLKLHPVHLPPSLAVHPTLDATSESKWPVALKDLCEILKQSVPEPQPLPRCPYPGMKPFAEKDSDRFFGRNNDVHELTTLLRHHTFVTVIGNSGCGKSSLVHAGLIPALRANTVFEPGDWHVYRMRPGDNPSATLAQTLGGYQENSIEAATSLSASTRGTGHLLLVVDQFEECFTRAKSGINQFAEELLQLSKIDCWYVIIVVRADFLGNLMLLPIWLSIRAYRYEVLPLTESGLSEAINGPIQSADINIYVAPELVTQLVMETNGEPGALPLLQETLVRLWDQMDQRGLTMDLYRSLVSKALTQGSATPTGLQYAIATYANEVVDSLTTKGANTIVRRIFLRLVHFGEGRPDTRRQVRVRDLRSQGEDDQLFSDTLRHLTESRLLTLGDDISVTHEEATVDISHEALITYWPTLKEWVRNGKAAEQTRRRLETQAKEWVRLGSGNAGLLADGSLREAEQWLHCSDAVDLGRDKLLTDFINASSQELKKLTKEKLRNTRFRIGAIAAIASLCVILLVIYSWDQHTLAVQQEEGAATANTQAQSEATARTQAEQQARFSRARELAASAIANIDLDPELSVLLARQAVLTTHSSNLSVTMEAVEALHRSVDASRIRLTLTGHITSVSSAVFSPDGRWVASSGAEGKATIQDASSGQTTLMLGDGKGAILGLNFSPDGTRLATAHEDHVVRIWAIPSGQLLNTLVGHTEAVWNVAYSPNGLLMATASPDKTARIWDSNTGRLLLTLPASDKQLRCVTFSPNGERIATGGDDMVPKVWDVKTGRLLFTLEGHTDSAITVVFSPDGSRLGTASRDGTARIWDSYTGKSLQVLSDPSDDVVYALYAITFSPDGRLIATSGEDKAVKIWDAKTGKKLFTLQGHTDWVWSLAFSRDSHRLVSSGRDDTARIWDVTGNGELFTLTGHSLGVHNVAYSHNGTLIATASKDLTIRIWDGLSGQLLHVLSGHTRPVWAVAFDPTDRYLASGSLDGTARVWDLGTGDTIRIITGHGGMITSVAISPDGRYLATAGTDANGDIWDLRNGNKVTTLRGHISELQDIAFTADGTRVVTASNDRTARVWNTITGRVEYTYTDHTDIVVAVSVSPADRQFATASFDGTVRIWGTSDKLPLMLIGPRDRVNDVTYSPDGEYVASASSDRTVRIWDVNTGVLLLTLIEYPNSVNGIAYSPDGQHLASANEDGKVRVYTLNVDELMEISLHHITRSLTQSECRKWLHLEQCPDS